ncbi:hypothetical protein HGM15179_016392 [Zosterops borbonicus]|uniref:H15 domain-containing protein n=1 Tax=Zosterops borbonicus TaxID=364589 RepID=A0A8K1G2N1_9PASS|nr:hypothetical protein HGM15179_016392 [Zosterops borbonicus]
MSETAPAAAPAVAAPAAKAAAKKPKKAASGSKARKPAGPSVTELITKAVSASKERKGLSLAALKKALAAGGYDVEKNNSRIKLGLKSLVSKGTLKPKKAASGSKARKPAGPSVTELITKAVSASKERKGLSLAALKKALAAGGYDVEKNNSRIKLGLKSLVSKGTLVQTKGTGASGSFRLSKKPGEVKEKAPKKRTAAAKPKKPAAKKPASAAKKPKKAAAVKKSPKKAKKPAAAAAKKAAKSPKKATKAAKPKKAAATAKSPAKAKAVKPKAAKPKVAKPKAAKAKKAAPKK